MKALLLSTSLFLMAGAAIAEDTTHVTVVTPDAITWKDNPLLPKGAQSAVLYGDPSKPGLFVQRNKFPANFQVPPHTHPNIETIVVLSGTWNVGAGDKFDKANTQPVKAGSFYVNPPNHAHYVWTSEPTIIELTSIGPAGINYVNAADDPRKSQ